MQTIVILLTTGGFALGLHAVPNLVVNGDFEQPPVTDRGIGFTTYKGGSSMPGWTVGGNSVDVVSDIPDAWVSWAAASGHQSVDLNGASAGSIYQALHPIAGQTYNLSFALAGNPVNAPYTVMMDFFWQGKLV